MIAPPMSYDRLVRFTLVFLTVLSLAMMGIRVSSYPSMLRLPGGTVYVVEVAGLLLLYGAVLIWGARSMPPKLLLRGTTIGLIAALVQVVHLVCERFVSFSDRWSGTISITFMLATFLLWGVTGFVATRSGQATSTGIWLAVWSAVVTMTVVVTLGFALEFFLAPWPPESMLSWGEFKRSGWTDIHAFAIANTLDAAFSHLLIGPAVAVVVGTGGSLLGRASGDFPKPKIASSNMAR
jgi:hypothetical protein